MTLSKELYGLDILAEHVRGVRQSVDQLNKRVEILFST